MPHLPIDAWETMHAHYDPPTYQAALGYLDRRDVVLDIGAGDLRFARQIAPLVDKVYAIEVNEQILHNGIASPVPLPPNLLPRCADARQMDFPADITCGVLLMRHCTHFGLYFEKLRTAGAQRLITNARWHMDVEKVDLHAPRRPFDEVDQGWYSCCCGAIGFKAGPAERWNNELDALTIEVTRCPRCKQVGNSI